jgi:hypothetical protein
LRPAAVALLTDEKQRPEQQAVLLSAVLRTCALLRRFIDHQTSAEAVDGMVDSARVDVEAYLRRGVAETG